MTEDLQSDGAQNASRSKDDHELQSMHSRTGKIEVGSAVPHVDVEQPQTTTRDTPVPQLSKRSLILITTALLCATFLVALDMNILATATPRITSEFRRLEDVAWYVATYNLSRMALQPTYGRVYGSFPLRFVFCYAIGLFCIGSIVCATAPVSAVLICGRAIQGVGGAGLFSGSLTMASFIVPKRRLPVYISILGSMFAVASVLGPVLGGVIAESSLTWRFCFWINLPLGAICIVFVLLTFQEPDRPATKKPLAEKLRVLDPVGTILLIGGLVCLILALESGGIILPWSDSRVWGCILGFVLLIAVFIYRQIKQKEDALIPMRILTQRTVAAAGVVGMCCITAMSTLVNYLPFYFQAARGLSPSTSGQYLLALAVPDPFGAFTTGLIATKTGHYVPWQLASSALMAVGAGLLSTLDLESSLAKMIGYQIIMGFGFGMGVQLPLTAIRNVLNDEDIPVGNSLFVFFHGLGGSLAVSIAQTIFISKLHGNLAMGLSETETQRIIELGAGSVTLEHISADTLGLVRSAYNLAVQPVAYLSVAAGGLAFVSACLMEWKRLPKKAK